MTNGLLSHGGHLEKTFFLCPVSLALKSFLSRAGVKTMDFILLGLNMAARDKSLCTVPLITSCCNYQQHPFRTFLIF
jgi:hypothetical protein